MLVFVVAVLSVVTLSESRPRDFHERFPIHFLGRGNVCSMTPESLEPDFSENCNTIGIHSLTCFTAWEVYKGAFAWRDPTTVKASDYDPYFEVLPIVAGPSQSLFWSGTFPIMNVISNNDLGATVVSSANADSSEIINKIDDEMEESLSWCGNEIDGIDYNTPCNCDVTGEFWVEFSALFAQSASGNAIFLGNGERSGGAYSDQSYFATVEIPNMTDEVYRIVALIIHERETGESCKRPYQESLVLLKKTVEDKGYVFDCYDLLGSPDDPEDTDMVAECAAHVINKIQMGTEGYRRKYNCKRYG